MLQRCDRGLPRVKEYILLPLYPVFCHHHFHLLVCGQCLPGKCIPGGHFRVVPFPVMALFIFFYALAESRGLLTGPLAQAIHFAMGAIATLVTVLMFIPLGKKPKALAGTRGMIEGNPERFNQRDTAFNIAHVGGYGPEVAKQRWALQSMDPYNGSFWTLVMGLRSQVDGKVNLRKRKNFTMEEITKEIKKTAKYLGADLVGITTVKEDFTYSEAFSYEESKLEKGPAVTTPVDLKHRYVVVLGKEMD